MRTLKVLEAQLEKARQKVEDLENMVEEMQVRECAVEELKVALNNTDAWDLSDSDGDVVTLPEELRKVFVAAVKKWLEAQ
jgi:cell division septal protein FtsQ